MSVFGTTFASDLGDQVAAIATQAAPFIVTILGIILGIIIVTFVFKFIKAHLGR